MIDLSIIIVNYRSWEKLSECLNSILFQKEVVCEIIVVDNFSNDGYFKLFKKKYSKVIWKENLGNLGFSSGCNFGASFASSKWLLFLNPDTIVKPNTLSPLLLYCEKECQNSLISIAQFNSAGTHLSSFGIFPNALNQIGLLRSLQRDVLSRTQNRKAVFKSKFSEVDWISGSFVLMTQDNFKSIGGWDERFWMYYEDVDLCLRAREKGIRILVLNFWECIHDHGGASRKTTRTKIITKSHVLISNLLYIRKHFAFPKRELALLFFLLSKFFNTLFIPKKSNLVPFVNLIKYLISNKKP